MHRSLFPLLLSLAACASTQGAARCPTTAPSQVSVAAIVPASGAPISHLLSTMPRDADVIVRVDVQRLFTTRIGRLLAPALVWSREYAAARDACTLRPWDEVRMIQFALRRNHGGVALLGPIASPGHRCAETVLTTRDESSPFDRISGPNPALVLGDRDVRDAVAAGLRGNETAQGDPAFANMGPSVDAPLATLLIRGAFLRQSVSTLLGEGSRAPDGGTPPADSQTPRRNPSMRMDLEGLLGGRIEVGQTPAGELDARATMLFSNPERARGFVTQSREDLRTRLPAQIAEALGELLRDSPDGRRAAQEISREAVAWAEEMTPMEARGPAVELRVGGGGSLLFAGMLSAVAIPAFTRYTRRSKTVEAVHDVGTISLSVQTAVNMEQSNGRRRRLAPIPPTPAEPPGEAPYSPNVGRWQTPGWRAIDFALQTSHRYQYRVDVEGNCYVVVAQGDLDGDGIRSTFSRSVCPGEDGDYVRGPLRIENELE
jgi:hypothetical protein